MKILIIDSPNQCKIGDYFREKHKNSEVIDFTPKKGVIYDIVFVKQDLSCNTNHITKITFSGSESYPSVLNEGKIRKEVLYKSALPNLHRNYEQSGRLILKSLKDFNYCFKKEKINNLLNSLINKFKTSKEEALNSNEFNELCALGGFENKIHYYKSKFSEMSNEDCIKSFESYFKKS